MTVLDDITIGLLNPKLLTIVTQESHFISLSWLRSTMENIALSSIMKLDNDSMNKLFDLMTMMVKYQLTAATGPREIILITLNHIDSFREIISTTNAHQCVTLVHEMIINVRNELIELVITIFYHLIAIKIQFYNHIFSVFLYSSFIANLLIMKYGNRETIV